MEILGIGHLLERKPGQLSGGQQQRVALGRAIVAEAPVCLMDEPLSNLDAQLRADMRREILALQRRLGITMLYVTHDQTEAMGMADQIVLLRDGHIEQDAAPADVYARPATSFAASFIGTPPMNLFPLEPRGAGMVMRGTDGPALAPQRSTGDVLGGIRPEHLRLAEHRHSRDGAARGISRRRHGGRVRGWRCDAAGASAGPRGADDGAAACSRHRRTGSSVRCGLRATDRARIGEGDGWRMIKITRRGMVQAAAATLAMPGIVRAADATEISFYFPVAVGGPITKIIDGYAADFQRENPSIKVTPIYAGTYQDTLTKAQTALKSNAGPQLAVLLSTDAFSLIDDDLVVPFDTVASSDADRAWLHSFYPAFLKNGEIDGHTWGVPFQRSTIVLFWNKAAFQQAGLNPDQAAAHLGRACPIRGEADEAERRRGRADGACRYRRVALHIGCSRHSRPRLVERSHRRMASRPTSPVPRVSRRCATGSICRANIMRIRLAWSNGERRHGISWSRRWR